MRALIGPPSPPYCALNRLITSYQCRLSKESTAPITSTPGAPLSSLDRLQKAQNPAGDASPTDQIAARQALCAPKEGPGITHESPGYQGRRRAGRVARVDIPHAVQDAERRPPATRGLRGSAQPVRETGDRREPRQPPLPPRPIGSSRTTPSRRRSIHPLGIQRNNR